MGKQTALTPAQLKRRQIRYYGILSIIFYLLALAFPVVVLIFSFSTIDSTTKIGNRTILNGNTEPKDDPCTTVGYGFSTNRPLRFSFGSNSSSNSSPYSCSWNVLNTVLRLVLSFVGIAVICLCFFFTFIRRSRNMYLFGILIALIGVGFGYIGYDDAADVANSNKWCNNDMKGVKWAKTPETIICMYTPFILVSLFDFLAAACWLLLSFFAICFVCKAGVGKADIKSGRLLPDDGEKPTPDDHFGPLEEEDTPDGPPAKKQSGGGFFNFFGRNKAQSVPDEPDTSNGQINFEKESSSRFAPMSKTDREAKDLPLGKSSGGAPGNSQTIGNALFNFDDVDTSATAAPQSQPQQPVQPEPVQPQPQPQPQQPKPQSGGVVDFEALAGVDSDPFAH